MKIIELKEFLETLPDDFDQYEVVNGEYVKIDSEYYSRVDKPVMFLTVDEESKELCVLHQTEEETIKIQE